MFPSNKKRSKRPDEVRGEGILEKLRKRREMKQEGEWEEKKREDKQVRKLAKVRKMEKKGKTKTDRYKKLKDEVYTPFPEPTSRKKAKESFKKGYTDRKTKLTGTRFETPVTPEQNINEYNTEKGEFYFTGGALRKGRVKMLPTDEGDAPITKGIRKRNLGKNWE